MKPFRMLSGLCMALFLLCSFAFSTSAAAAPILGPCCDPIVPKAVVAPAPQNSTGPHSVSTDFSTGPHSITTDPAPADKPPVKITPNAPILGPCCSPAPMSSTRPSVGGLTAGMAASLHPGGAGGISHMAALSGPVQRKR
jgi:hypothetical protein